MEKMRPKLEKHFKPFVTVHESNSAWKATHLTIRSFFKNHKKLSYVLLVVLVLLLLEGASGLVIYSSHHFFNTPKRISKFQIHPIFRGENIRNYTSSWSEAYPVFGYVNKIFVSEECGFTTDKHGFIHNGDQTRNIQLDSFKIFILGGSTVAGHGSSCNNQTISSHLERIINKNNKNIQVINAGVAGYYSAQEMIKISNEILFYDPDIIISFNGTNDFIKDIQAFDERDFHYFISGYHKSLYKTLSDTKSLWWSLKNFVHNLTKYSEYTYTRFVIEKGLEFFGLFPGFPRRYNERDLNTYLFCL